jgi:hypothetical protein
LTPHRLSLLSVELAVFLLLERPHLLAHHLLIQRAFMEIASKGYKRSFLAGFLPMKWVAM